MAIFKEEFPFNELRMPDGDYYQTIEQMERAGFEPNQMWSVVEAESDDGSEWYIYGPRHHRVNRMYYVATAEYHDGETYYEECVKEPDPFFCPSCDD
jgi:hypothetical protein